MKEIKEQEGSELLADFVKGFAKHIESNKSSYIKEMIESMKIQADIIQRARKDGVDINALLPEIQKEYESSK